MRRQRALVISPFATVPLDAGQRLRVYQSTKIFEDLGYDITFFLYAFEDGWYWKSQPALVEKLSSQWRNATIVYSHRQVSLPPKNGAFHRLDEWWDERLELSIKNMVDFEEFDICVVHNVWLSKAFDFLPRRIKRIIDTHDLFSTRKTVFDAAGAEPEFLILSSEDEKFGLQRADLVLTIKPQDATALAAQSLARRVINLPYCPDERLQRPAPRDYVHPEKVVFGFLGSGHVFNKVGLEALLIELDYLVRHTFAPVEIIVAGNIGRALDFNQLAFHPICLGYVDDEATFYDRVDVAVVPVFSGTGFKVKVAELIELHKPMLCAEHAAEGTSLAPDQVFSDANSMAQAMVRIAMYRPELAHMAEKSATALQRLRSELRDARSSIGTFLRDTSRTEIFLFDEIPMSGPLLTQLLAFVLQARSVASDRRSVFVLPRCWCVSPVDLNLVSGLGTEFILSDALSHLLSRIEGGNVTFWGTPGALHCHRFPNSSALIAINDCRFMDFNALNQNDLFEVRMLRGALVNHRQAAIPEILPFSQEQEVFCGPLLAWEATWDPVVGVLVRHFLRKVPPARNPVVYVCSGTANKRALGDITDGRNPAGSKVFDVEDVQDLEILTATVLSRILYGTESFSYVCATRSASWLWALVDHGERINGNIKAWKLKDWTDRISKEHADPVGDMSVFRYVRARVEMAYNRSAAAGP